MQTIFNSFVLCLDLYKCKRLFVLFLFLFLYLFIYLSICLFINLFFHVFVLFYDSHDLTNFVLICRTFQVNKQTVIKYFKCEC